MDENTLYTAKEVADYLKIDVRTVYEMIKSGNLQAMKIGRDYRISGRALNNYLQDSVVTE